MEIRFFVCVNSLKLSAFARFPKEQEKSNSVGLIRAIYALIPKSHTERGQKCCSVRIIDTVGQRSAQVHCAFEWVHRSFESLSIIACMPLMSYLKLRETFRDLVKCKMFVILIGKKQTSDCTFKKNKKEGLCDFYRFCY